MTSALKRLYLVQGLGSTHLVEASSQAQALQTVVKSVYTVKVASALEVGRLLTDGVKITQVAEQIPTEAAKL